MALVGNPSPYDNWERYELSLKEKFMLLFLSKEEREAIYKRIERINAQRKEDCRIEQDKIRMAMVKKIVKPPKGGTGETSFKKHEKLFKDHKKLIEDHEEFEKELHKQLVKAGLRRK